MLSYTGNRSRYHKAQRLQQPHAVQTHRLVGYAPQQQKEGVGRVTQLAARRGAAKGVRSGLPDRLTRTFDAPVLAWQRLPTRPLDAAYYVLLGGVLLGGGAEQVLWINQRAPHEPKIARSVAATGLLAGFTPPLVCADTTLTRLEYPYLVTGYLPTPTLASTWPHLKGNARHGAASAWGAAVRSLHRTRFSLAGDLAEPEAAGRHLGDDLEGLWRTPLRLAVKDYMLDTPKLVSTLRRGRTLLQDAPVALTHGHPGAGSFLYDPRGAAVTAVLDLGDARRSDPMMDLAAVADDLTTLGCEDAFMEGYGALSRWEKARVSFYRLHHALLRYAEALTVVPNELATRRMRLAELASSREY